MKYINIPEPEGFFEIATRAIERANGKMVVITKGHNTGLSTYIDGKLVVDTPPEHVNHPHGWYRKFEKRNKRK